MSDPQADIPRGLSESVPPSLHAQSEDAWDAIYEALTSSQQTIFKMFEDPDAWSYWCKTGGGVAGERLLQITQAVVAAMAHVEV